MSLFHVSYKTFILDTLERMDHHRTTHSIPLKFIRKSLHLNFISHSRASGCFNFRVFLLQMLFLNTLFFLRWHMVSHFFFLSWFVSPILLIETCCIRHCLENFLIGGGSRWQEKKAQKKNDKLPASNWNSSSCESQTNNTENSFRNLTYQLCRKKTPQTITRAVLAQKKPYWHDTI